MARNASTGDLAYSDEGEESVVGSIDGGVVGDDVADESSDGACGTDHHVIRRVVQSSGAPIITRYGATTVTISGKLSMYCRFPDSACVIDPRHTASWEGSSASSVQIFSTKEWVFGVPVLIGHGGDGELQRHHAFAPPTPGETVHVHDNGALFRLAFPTRIPTRSFCVPARFSFGRVVSTGVDALHQPAGRISMRPSNRGAAMDPPRGPI